MGFFKKLIPSVVSGGMGIIGSLIGGKSAAKEGATERKFGAEQAYADRVQRDKEIALKARELGISEDQFRQMFGLREKEFGLREEESIEEREMAQARKQAYESMIAKGGEQFAAGEAGFMGEAGKTPAELEQMKKDILSGKSEALQLASGQLQAGLAQQGMRGGQAGTQLRRGIGEMGIQAQRDINKLIGGDAMRRAAERRAYMATKARTGQQAGLRPAAF